MLGFLDPKLPQHIALKIDLPTVYFMTPPLLWKNQFALKYPNLLQSHVLTKIMRLDLSRVGAFLKYGQILMSSFTDGPLSLCL